MADVDKLSLKVTASAGQATAEIQKLSKALKELGSVGDVTGKKMDSLGDKLAKVGTRGLKLGGVFRRIGGLLTSLAFGKILSNAWGESSGYIEDINLFTTSLGKYSDEAMAYSEMVSEKLGIDQRQWLRNQGYIMSMATGFGLTEEKAYKMSKGLNQVAYDISSMFNKSLDAEATGAFAKVQSGFAGELEPLRRIGYALDQASLQQTAYNHGISESITQMTQAEKAALRYTAIVEQTRAMGAVHDMAYTLESPANAVRILQQEFNVLSRNIGNIFLPAVMVVIPWVQALTKVLIECAQAIAKLFGFDLKDWTQDNSQRKFADNTGAAATNLDKAGKKAKKLKDYLMGFDELNVIKPPDDSDSGDVGIGGSWLDDFDPQTVWDDQIIAAIETKAGKLKEVLEPILEIVGGIAAAFALWEISQALFTGLESLGLLAEGTGKTLGQKVGSALAGATLLITGAILIFKGIKGIIEDGEIDLKDKISIIGGEAAALAGGLLMGRVFGKALVGGAIAGAVAGVAGLITAFYDAIVNGVDEDNAQLALISGVLGGAAIGALFGPIGVLIGAGVGAIVAGIGELVIAFRQNWDEIKAICKEKAEHLKEYWVGVWNDRVEDVKEIFGKIVDRAKEIVENVKTGISEKFDLVKTTVVNKVTDIKDSAAEKWDAIKQKFSDTIEGLKSFLEHPWETFKEFVAGKATAIKDGFIEKFGEIKQDAVNILEKWAMHSNIR